MQERSMFLNNNPPESFHRCFSCADYDDDFMPPFVTMCKQIH